MPVTDLTGTTWVFNDSIDISSFGKTPQTILTPGEALPNDDSSYYLDGYIDDEGNTMTALIAVKIVRFQTTNILVFPILLGISSGSKLVITGGTDATNTNLINWIEANATQQAVSTKVSVDIAALPGWSSLSAGSHNITVVAKADGYRDSEPSAAVSVTKGTQEYTDCITFTGETSDFTLKATNKEWDGTVEYSTDHNTWTAWDGSAISSSGQKLYLRGSGNTKFLTKYGARLNLSAKAACSGNIQTLLEYSNPPTEVANSCYSYMFYGCTNLTTAPALPATTLANSCYYSMFDGCTSLTQAPTLPATTLTEYCYHSMFASCTNLIQTPELPATTLAEYCYSSMFRNCTSLKISATQSAEYPTAWRIPSSGTISSTASNWNFYMLNSTGGTFTSDPNINTTYYGAWTSATPTLISFTINGTSYQAEEGMTWAEWVNSEYNTDGYIVDNDYISLQGYRIHNGLAQTLISSSTITKDEIYNTGYTVTLEGGGYDTWYINRFCKANLSDGTTITPGDSIIQDVIMNHVVSILFEGAGGSDMYISYRIPNGESREVQLSLNDIFNIPDDITIFYVNTPNCLWEGTSVTMADGSLKALGDIKVGDEVLSIDYDTMTLVGRKVIYSGRDEPDYDHWETPIYYENVFSDGTVIRQSMHHRFYNLEQQRYVYLHEWNIGEHSYNINGENPALISRKLIQAPQRYARITLEGSNNWFANGLSTGDRHCPTDIILTDLLQ